MRQSASRDVPQNPAAASFPVSTATARLRAMTKQVTVGELKAMIIRKLNIKSVTAEALGDDDPLFGPTGLGLDSVDALELVLAIESE